uniref:Uncharacterized protein n=1 Tax=Rhizophora mucronata TaxID=61149 RepID=A0A2P2PYX6_RHIMU
MQEIAVSRVFYFLNI